MLLECKVKFVVRHSSCPEGFTTLLQRRLNLEKICLQAVLSSAIVTIREKVLEFLRTASEGWEGLEKAYCRAHLRFPGTAVYSERSKGRHRRQGRSAKPANQRAPVGSESCVGQSGPEGPGCQEVTSLLVEGGV